VNNITMARPPDLNERILVRELTHRINNQLTSAINVVTAAAVRADHLEAKVALGNVVELNAKSSISIMQGS
jgi:two-component sensor histidine kinase